MQFICDVGKNEDPSAEKYASDPGGRSKLGAAATAAAAAVLIQIVTVDVVGLRMDRNMVAEPAVKRVVEVAAQETLV